MPADHPLIIAATAESGLVQDTLLDAFMKRMPLTIGPTETLNDIVQSVGSTPLSIVNSTTGLLYFYDETDTTTADDGLTCLVDGLGHRYKVQDSATVGISSVLAIEADPPASPSIGDAYVVDVAPTGAWAANAKDIAVWTVRGWVYAAPSVGTTLLNEDTGLNIQYSAAGAWGEFAADIGTGTITPATLEFPAGIIVETTENTPPGAPTTGKFWIVGSVPTGAFVGHAADLAYWTGSAWAFLDPAEGWSVYNKQAGFEVYYTAGVWLGATGSEVQTFSTAGAATWTKPAKGTMALIQAWGAGGSGGRNSASDAGSGGGGGAYVERWMPLADLPSTVAVTVGAGGAARTTDNTNGAAGGNSSFGSYLIGYGGGGGLGNTGGGTSAAGGGGIGGAGASAVSEGVGGHGGDGMIAGLAGSPLGYGAAPGGAGAGGDTVYGGGGGGVINVGSSSSQRGGHSVYGGGGGGTGHDAGTGGAGGQSLYGGGGGGGGGGSGGGAGGASFYGGNGGAGATAGGNGTAGAQPGGGGGGSESGNSGKGGDGRVRVTVV